MEYLDPRPGQNFVDGTFGRGGHASAILERIGSAGHLFVFDVDPESIAVARSFGPNITAFQKNFREIEETIKYVAHDITIHGAVLDLGISSSQLSDPALGLSFQEAGPLNMRLGRNVGMTAATIVNTFAESEIAKLIRDLGEERHARIIARAIVSRRRTQAFTLTTDLASVVAGVVGRGFRGPSRIHPATKTFQALRLAVNDELENLRLGVGGLMRMMASGARLAVISFHSLEDRLVKQLFKKAAQGCVCPPEFPRCVCVHSPTARVITKRPITPTAREVMDNPRARSAKLRVIEKI